VNQLGHQQTLCAAVIHPFAQPATTVELVRVASQLIPHQDVLHKPARHHSTVVVANPHCGQNPKVFVLQKENNDVTKS
jgi:hypothetical protein